MNTTLKAEPHQEWTAEDFFHSPLSQDHEIIEGELVKTMPAGFIHGVVALKIGRLMGDFVEENKYIRYKNFSPNDINACFRFGIIYRQQRKIR